MRRPVVVAAGGTGGHVIPALAVAAELRSQDIPVIWIGTRAGLEARLVPAAGIDIHWISVAGLRGKNVLQTLMAPIKLARSFVQSVSLLRALKPAAVLGMGGFVSGPVGLAALLLRKPLVLHEQNAVAGMTNRWLSAKARRVFSAWEDVFAPSVNASVVGNPVGRDIASLSGVDKHFDESRPLSILIVGGSRGARALNEIVPEAIALLDAPVRVLHQAGMNDAELVRERYQHAAQADVEVAEFIDDMTRAYSEADLVICRSGAMTVTELGALGMPSILVPFPYAVDDHQTRNAQRLSLAGGAILLPQSDLTPASLKQVLQPLLINRASLVRMSESARRCFTPNAASNVAQALIEVSL